MLLFLDQYEFDKPALIGLLLFHLILTTITFVTRKSCNIQAVFFFCLLSLVYFSQEIIKNSFITWKVFRSKSAEENQFLFSIIYSVPILLNCMLIIGNWLWQSSQLMIELKREQLKKSLKNKSQ